MKNLVRYFLHISTYDCFMKMNPVPIIDKSLSSLISLRLNIFSDTTIRTTIVSSIFA